jgi:CARDB
MGKIVIQFSEHDCVIVQFPEEQKPVSVFPTQNKLIDAGKHLVGTLDDEEGNNLFAHVHSVTFILGSTQTRGRETKAECKELPKSGSAKRREVQYVAWTEPLVDVDELKGGKVDLVPSSDCRKKDGQLVVTVKNKGKARAPESTTTVQFARSEPASKLTPSIPANDSVELLFDIPGTCASNCRFRTIVDSNYEADESEISNNVAEGVCKG